MATTRRSTRRALLLRHVVLLCALACVATAATTTTSTTILPTQAPLAPAGASARTLRQEKDRAKPQQLKQEPDADEGGDEDADDQLRSATNNKQPLLEKPLEKSTGRPITRVYDPVTGLFCELEGDCHACPVSEKDEAYCRETGNRQEMRCPRSPDATTRPTTSPLSDADSRLPEIRFRACVPLERANPFRSVVLFELLMAAAFAATFALLRKEQQKHVSSFDLRKDPRQRATLLGSSTSSSSGQKGAD